MIKYLHVRQIDDEGNLSPNGGLTVAYTCTLTDIILQVARCHENDLFCHRIGRAIATGRLQSGKVANEVIPLTHPITQCIVDWLCLEHFTVPIAISLDSKNRWVSNFEPDDGVEVVHDDDWRNQIPQEDMIRDAIIIEMDSEMRYDG